MKRLILLVMILTGSLAHSQDVKPIDANNKGLQSPNNPTWYYNTVTKKIGLWKGSYGWNEFFSAKAVQSKIDSLDRVKTDSVTATLPIVSTRTGDRVFNISINTATSTTSGVMSPGDKAALDSLKTATPSGGVVVDNGKSTANVLYGGLYNWYAVAGNKNVANTGWHVPTLSDFTTLQTYLGGASVAGGKLKETGTTHWQTPNTGATNTSGFNAFGSGRRDTSFDQLRYNTWFWASTMSLSLYPDFLRLQYNTSTTELSYINDKTYGHSVRLVKDATTLTNGQTSTYTGNDGKVYPTICIGGQEWLACNLAETKFRGGEPIPVVTGNAAWSALTTPAMCYYNNTIANAGTTTPIYTASDTLNLSDKQDAFISGNLTESITGLQFDATRQVIGGAADLSLTPGYAIPTTTQITNATTAYNDKINSLAVTGTSTKTVTLTQQDGGTVTTTFAVSKADVGLSNVDNTSDANKPVSTATQTALNLKADKTTTINGYDLSTNRTLTTSDIAPSTDRKYVTDAEKVVIGNTSGVNTGDQDLSGKQNVLNGTGFVKANGTTISYDNSTYLPYRTFGTAANNNTGDFAQYFDSKGGQKVNGYNDLGASFFATEFDGYVGGVIPNNPTNEASYYGAMINVGATPSRGFQLASQYAGIWPNDLWFRTKIDAGYNQWNKLWHSGNFNPSNYAPSSGSGNYVQVSPASAQSGNIWIDGNSTVAGSGYFGDNLTLGNTNAIISGGTNSGRIIMANTSITAYGIFYGSTHETTPNLAYFTGSSIKLDAPLNVSGAATFSSSINAPTYKLNNNDLFGSLSANYLPKWDGGKFVNSLVSDDGNTVGISGISKKVGFETLGAGFTTMLGTVDNYDFSIKNNRGATSELIVGNGYIYAITNGLERFRISDSGVASFNTIIPSTSPTTGALTVAGGLGVGGNVNVGDVLTLNKDKGFVFNAYNTGGRNRIFGVTSDYPDNGYSFYQTNTGNDYIGFHVNGNAENPTIKLYGNGNINASKIITTFNDYGTTSIPKYDPAISSAYGNYTGIDFGNSGQQTHGTFIKFTVNSHTTASTPISALVLSPTDATFSGNINAGGNITATGNISTSGTISAASTVSGTDFLQSDRRLKENIQDICFGNVDKLKFVQYELKTDPLHTLKTGVIAQDVEKYFPQYVHTATDSMQTKSVDYIGLLVLTNAKNREDIKQSNQRIKALEERITVLEGLISNGGQQSKGVTYFCQPLNHKINTTKKLRRERHAK